MTPTAGPGITGAATPRILVVCTANVCRSPVVERLVQSSLDSYGLWTVARSAGTHAGENRVHSDTAMAAAEVGVDLSAHASRLLTADVIEADGATLIITMTRAHLYRVVELVPSSFPRAFTLPELVQLAASHGVEPLSLDIEGWLRAIGADRSTGDVTGGGTAYDVNDPYGHPFEMHRVMVREVREMVGAIIPLLAASVDIAVVNGETRRTQ